MSASCKNEKLGSYPKYHRKIPICTNFHLSKNIFPCNRNTLSPVFGWLRIEHMARKRCKGHSRSRCPVSFHRTFRSSTNRICTDCNRKYRDLSRSGCCPVRCNFSWNSNTRRFFRQILHHTRTLLWNAKYFNLQKCGKMLRTLTAIAISIAAAYQTVVAAMGGKLIKTSVGKGRHSDIYLGHKSHSQNFPSYWWLQTHSPQRHSPRSEHIGSSFVLFFGSLHWLSRSLLVEYSCRSHWHLVCDKLKI